MNLTFRPLPRWPHPEQRHRPATFCATFHGTLADVQAYRRAVGG